MINCLIKRVKILNLKFSQQERSRINAENEYQAMSCGSFNPRFLAKIKKSKVVR